MEALREGTRVIHQKIHGLPYFRSILDTSVSAFQYANHLHALSVIWCALEHQMKMPGITKKWPLLSQDLQSLQALKINAAVIDVALEITSKLLLRTTMQPESLLGVAYVMQGSLNGAGQLCAKINTALGHNLSTHYFSIPQEEVTQQWLLFGKIVNATPAVETLHAEIVLAAKEFFEDLFELFRLIGGIRDESGLVHITAINPEAGNHPMPQEPPVIAAAIRAGVRTWVEYPYLAARYGERGKRFSKSDSCWLATLVSLPAKEVEQQIYWLAKLLAVRGIPSVILVRQLRHLSRAMSEAEPAAQASHASLTLAAQSLVLQRRGFRSEDDFERIAASWELGIREIGDFPENSGEILLSAYADARTGWTTTDEDILLWYEKSYLSDSTRRGKFMGLREEILKEIL